MQNFFLVLAFFLAPISIIAQSEENNKKDKILERELKTKPQEKKKDSIKQDSITINDYKIFYEDGSYISIDTSLSIKKDYKFNFLRKDNFELLSFANVGHTFNKLSYSFTENSNLPMVGARSKHYHYFEKKDIGYYNVPTPFTEIFAKSTFEQGQILDFLLSINLTPQYNFTIAQKGYKSLGKYVSSRSRGNQTRFSSNFNSKNQKTRWKFHITSQNIFNKENGGLTADDIYFFEQAPNYFELDNSGNRILLEDGSYKMVYYDGYLDRSRLGTLIYSESSLYSKRFFSHIKRTILRNKNNKNDIISLDYKFTHEYKKLQFSDDLGSIIFGDLIVDDKVSDESRFIKQENEVIATFDLNKIGKFDFSLNSISWLNKFKEYEDSAIDLINELNLNQQILSFDWIKKFKNSNIQFSYINSLKDRFLLNSMSLNFNSTFFRNFNMSIKSSLYENSPNFNYVLHRSIYSKYNWHNENLENQKTKNASIEISYKDLIKVYGEYNEIENYTFFRETADQLNGEIESKRFAIVEQNNSQIKYFKIKIDNKIDIGKFSLNNTALFQKKEQTIDFGQLSTLNVPEWITRNTIMFSSDIFNNSLFIQTGITFNYFTKFYADYYNPLLSEFVTQNYKEIGDYPRFDFFFNARIQQTRVFIKVEHLNSSFTGYDYYSDPFNPYRDLSVRLGLVWNFFQ